jgi:hypothetical protein
MQAASTRQKSQENFNILTGGPFWDFKSLQIIGQQIRVAQDDFIRSGRNHSFPAESTAQPGPPDEGTPTPSPETVVPITTAPIHALPFLTCSELLTTCSVLLADQ